MYYQSPAKQSYFDVASAIEALTKRTKHLILSLPELDAAVENTVLDLTKLGYNPIGIPSVKHVGGNLQAGCFDPIISIKVEYAINSKEEGAEIANKLFEGVKERLPTDLSIEFTPKKEIKDIVNINYWLFQAGDDSFDLQEKEKLKMIIRVGLT